jgi:hypothetical protein
MLNVTPAHNTVVRPALIVNDVVFVYRNSRTPCELPLSSTLQPTITESAVKFTLDRTPQS